MGYIFSDRASWRVGSPLAPEGGINVGLGKVKIKINKISSKLKLNSNQKSPSYDVFRLKIGYFFSVG